MAERYNLFIISLLVLGVFVIFFVQFMTPTLYGADGYLHIRMAEFLKQYGPRYDFHWARYSTFNGNFADKDFLFHVLLIPFTFFKDIFLGAKVSSAIFASFLFLGFFLILRKYANRYLLPFFLASFFLSAMFLEAINRPRPIAIVILITIFSIHLLIEKKSAWVFFMGVIYSLGHVTSPLLIFYALMVESVRYLHKKEFSVRMVLSAGAGILTGFIVHPNFPDNFFVFYLNSIMVPIYTIRTGILELGAEFFPLNTREYLLGYPVVIIVFILFMYAAISRRGKARFETDVFLTISMFFFILSFICRRYLLHGYLLMLIGFSAYFSDAYQESKSITKKAVVVLCLALLALGFNSFSGVRYNALVNRIFNTHYENMGNWLSQNIPEGELVFHANWSDSQYFIGLNPKNDYFVTLDPVYMYHWNPELYKVYRDLAFGRINNPYFLLRDKFKVKYGYAGKNYFSGLIEQIRKDSKFKILAEDNLGVVFELTYKGMFK